jgi:hypothetical protein
MQDAQGQRRRIWPFGAMRSAWVGPSRTSRIKRQRAHSGRAYANLVDASRDRQPWFRRRPRSELGVGDRQLPRRPAWGWTCGSSPMRSPTSWPTDDQSDPAMRFPRYAGAYRGGPDAPLAWWKLVCAGASRGPRVPSAASGRDHRTARSRPSLGPVRSGRHRDGLHWARASSADHRLAPIGPRRTKSFSLRSCGREVQPRSFRSLRASRGANSVPSVIDAHDVSSC